MKCGGFGNPCVFKRFRRIRLAFVNRNGQSVTSGESPETGEVQPEICVSGYMLQVSG